MSRRAQAGRWLLALLVFTLASPLAIAGPWLVSRCELAIDPLSSNAGSETGLGGCIRGGLGLEATTSAETKKEGNWIPYGSVYGGLFAGPYISGHVLSRWRDVHALNSGELRSASKFVDYAVLQIGNPALDRYRVTFGRMRIPFGLDLSLAPQFYQNLENRRFWRSPPIGTYVTFDDLRRFRLDIGLASKLARELENTQGQSGSESAFSIRGALDLSALEGTRIIASIYAATKGERRYGLALSNTNRKGDQTTFEFVRRQIFASGQYAPFEQLLRLAYTGTWQKSGRWVIQFDDERLRFRRIVANLDKPIFNHLVMKIAVGFKAMTDETRESSLTLTCGVETIL